MQALAAAPAAGCVPAATSMAQLRSANAPLPAAPALRRRRQRGLASASALSVRHAERGGERDGEKAPRASPPAPNTPRPQGEPLQEEAEVDGSRAHVTLAPPAGGGAIHLFGVIHGGNESAVAEFVMRERPSVVVVETSLNSAHGSAHGNTICRADCLTFAHASAPGSHEQRARMFAQYGVQLADMAHPLGSHLWHDLSQVSCSRCSPLAWLPFVPCCVLARFLHHVGREPWFQSTVHSPCRLLSRSCASTPPVLSPRVRQTDPLPMRRPVRQPTLQVTPACLLRRSRLQGSRALYNEQLVYVAAFAVGADLVFGDRPKQITYSRMLWLPSIGAPRAVRHPAAAGCAAGWPWQPRHVRPSLLHPCAPCVP